MGKQAIAGASRGQHFFVHPERVTIIGRDTDHGAGDHPLYDERAERECDEPRVRNIRVYGIKVAVVIRKNGKHPDGPFKGDDVLEVIDGRGRTIDCREAHSRAEKAGEAPPQLKVEFERSDEDTQVGVMVSLNEHRTGDTPMNRARKAGRILAMGRSVEDVANMFNVSAQAIGNWQRLLELSKPVQKAIDAGKIAASAAVQLRKLSHEDQKIELDKLIKEAKANGKKRPTARQARGHVESSGQKLSKGVARKLLADEESELSAEVKAVLVWFVHGDDKAIKRVKGLTQALRKAVS